MRRFLGQGGLVLGVVMSVLATAASGGATIAGASSAPTGGATTLAGPPAFPGLPPDVRFGAANLTGAGPTAPTIGASKTTGLVPGETITITGDGFAPTPAEQFGVALVECVAGAASTSQCALGTVTPASADSAGHFSTGFSVQRTIRLFGNFGDQAVRCDSAPGACGVFALSVPDFAPLASVALSFDPNAPRPATTLRILPRQNLLDGQRVKVRGTGFLPGRFIEISQCAVGVTRCSRFGYYGVGARAGSSAIRSSATAAATAAVTAAVAPGPDDGYGETQADGSFVGFLVVTLATQTENGSSTHCLAVRCEIRVSDYLDPEYDKGRVIVFDAHQPVPTIPQLSVTPATHLTHNQVVTVRGHGFEPNSAAYVSECGATSFGFCDETLDFVDVDANGEFTVDLRVTRLVAEYGESFTPTAVDCVTVGCSISADSVSFSGNGVGRALRAVSPIAFDASKPTPALPVVSVTPTERLPFQAVLTVHGTGYFPGEQVSIGRCVEATDEGFCSYGSRIIADGNGVVDGTVSVRRSTGTGTAMDCASPEVVCSVEISGEHQYEQARVEIHFDPTTTPPPPPILRVSPRRMLADRQLVHVRGSGWLPDDQVLLAECVAGAPPENPESGRGCTGYQPAIIDHTGHLDATFAVHRRIDSGNGAVTDCAQSIGTCVMAVGEGFSDSLRRLRLGFDPNAPMAPPPVVTVSPRTHLEDGASVHVSGTGFTPDQTVYVTQCRRGFTQLQQCALPDGIIRGALVIADHNGVVDTNFTVKAIVEFLSGSGTYDCTTAPNRCAIVVLSASDLLARDSQPISFG